MVGGGLEVDRRHSTIIVSARLSGRLPHISSRSSLPSISRSPLAVATVLPRGILQHLADHAAAIISGIISRHSTRMRRYLGDGAMRVTGVLACRVCVFQYLDT